jgi:hypothetical protein
LPQQEREQLHAAFQRFQQLTPDQRDQLMRQWHSEMRDEPSRAPMGGPPRGPSGGPRH